MKIDFHTHVKISKSSQFMVPYFEDMILEAKEAGLTAICMTEHFNTLRFFDIYDYLDSHYTYKHHYYNVQGLKVFTGMEVDVKEVGHILILGHRDDIVNMRKRLIPYEVKPNFIPFKELMDLADEFNTLRIGGHPLREGTPLTQHDPEQLKRLDALDLNGRDLYAQGQELYIERLEEFANKLDLPIVGGSDTHQYMQYGVIVNESSVDCQTVDDLKQMIQEDKYEIHISDDLEVKVKAAQLVKKLIKGTLDDEGYATIYDYVSRNTEPIKMYG